MAHSNTILQQLLKLVSRHEFETLAKQHHCGRSFRTASRWSQFVILMAGQLSGRNSLRDLVDNISAQAHRPERWSGPSRNWEHEGIVFLNPNKSTEKEECLKEKAA